MVVVELVVLLFVAVGGVGIGDGLCWYWRWAVLLMVVGGGDFEGG